MAISILTTRRFHKNDRFGPDEIDVLVEALRIDKEEKELIWQGIGTGALRMENRDKKEERIKEFVKEIISRFPPGSEKQ